MLMIVYVDEKDIQNLEDHLATSIDIKALGLLTYFLGIEVTYSKSGIVLSQHKYILDLLKETGKLEYRLATTPTNVNVKLKAEQHKNDASINKTSF